MIASHRPRFLAALAVALGSLLAPMLPAHAAPPSNDSIATPVNVGALPWTYSQDTSQATSSASDGECVRGSSVWYRYRPTTDGRRRVVTIGSEGFVLLALFRGPRDNRVLLRCRYGEDHYPAAAAYNFEAGRTYWIAVSACCSRSARGGNVVLTVYRGKPLVLSVTVDTAASGDVSGRVILSGTVTCSVPAIVSIGASVSQRIGDANVAHGSTSSGKGEDGGLGTCDADGETWTLAIDSETGWAFQPGQAMVSTFSSAYDGFNYVEHDGEPTVMQLTSAPNARIAH